MICKSKHCLFSKRSKSCPLFRIPEPCVLCNWQQTSLPVLSTSVVHRSAFRDTVCVLDKQNHSPHLAHLCRVVEWGNKRVKELLKELSEQGWGKKKSGRNRTRKGNDRAKSSVMLKSFFAQVSLFFPRRLMADHFSVCFYCEAGTLLRNVNDTSVTSSRISLVPDVCNAC